MAKNTWALHTLTGQVARIDDHILTHPTFAPYLVEVAPGTPSYLPEMYKPQTAEEYLAARAKREKKATPAPQVAPVLDGEPVNESGESA